MATVLPPLSTCATLSFVPIETRADRIAIVATGPSAYGVDFSKLSTDVHVIAVKGAINSLRRVNSWMTVDCNDRTRKHYLQRLRDGVTYYAAVPDDYGTSNARIAWHRHPAEDGVHWLRRISTGDRNGTRCLSEDRSCIHSGNSAYGALGLAYHMRPSRIAIFGVDCTQAPYGLGGAGRPRGWLGHLPSLFATALPQLSAANIAIVCGAPRSRLRMPKLTADEAIEWLNAV